MFAVVQLIRGAIIAVIKQSCHFVYITFFRFRRAFFKMPHAKYNCFNNKFRIRGTSRPCSLIEKTRTEQ